MVDKNRQHYIPAMYLRGFVDPTAAQQTLFLYEYNKIRRGMELEEAQLARGQRRAALEQDAIESEWLRLNPQPFELNTNDDAPLSSSTSADERPNDYLDPLAGKE
jgi:hypothetical protein